MTDKKISRFPIKEANEMPEDLQAVANGAEQGLGFVPNVFKALAHRPEQLRAFLQYNNAVMNREGSSLTPAEKELLIIGFSGENGCIYCCQSHGAQYRLQSGNKYVADQVAVNYHEADLTPREKAIVAFGIKVSMEPAKIDEDDYAVLRTHGLDDEDIWDVAAITAFYNLSNRMMSFLAVHPDEEWYSLGR